MTTISDADLLNIVESISRTLSSFLPNAHPAPDQRMQELITALPKLTETDVDLDGNCPICLVPFRAHLAEEEMALAMESPAHAPEDLGVTRLESTCKHTFCRKDITTWIRQLRNTCPTCRRPLLDPLPDEPGNSTDLQTAPDAPSPDERRIILQMFDQFVDIFLDNLSRLNTTMPQAAPAGSSRDASAEMHTNPASPSSDELNAQTHASPALSTEDHYGASEETLVAAAHPPEGQQHPQMPSAGDYLPQMLQAAGFVTTGQIDPAIIETLDRLIEAMILPTPTPATTLQSDDTSSFPNNVEEDHNDYPDRSEFEMYS